MANAFMEKHRGRCEGSIGSCNIVLYIGSPGLDVGRSEHGEQRKSYRRRDPCSDEVEIAIFWLQ